MRVSAIFLVLVLGAIGMVDIWTDHSDPVRVCSIKPGKLSAAFEVSTTDGLYIIQKESIELKNKIKEGGTYKFTHNGSIPLLRSNNIKAIEPLDPALVTATCP